MRLLAPPQVVRVMQLPVYGLLVACIFLLGLLNVIPAADTLILSAVAVAVLAAATFLWSGSNLLTYIFLTYTCLVFLLVYPSEARNEGALLFLIVMGGFLLGRTVEMFCGGESRDRKSPPVNRRADHIPGVLILGIAISVACLLYLLASYGPGQFYSGAYLTDEIKTYAAGSTNGLVLNALGTVGSILCLSGIAIYSASGRPSISLTGFVLLALPLFSLSRGGFVMGAICMAYIYRKRLRVRHLALLAALAFAVAVTFGGIRQAQITGGRGPGLSSAGAVLGELSVSECVHLIAGTVREEGPTYGKNFFGPIVTMPVPRSLYPEKPLLTSAEITWRYFPEEARNGLGFAPTIFGDWLYNFGDIGVLLVSFGLGFLFRRLDKSDVCFLGVVISFACFPILRNNTAQSLFTVVACIAVKHLQKVRLVRSSNRSGLPIRASAAHGNTA